MNTNDDTKFKAGQSGNPKGRPRKGASLRDKIQEFFTQKDPQKDEARIEVLLKTAYEKAVTGKKNLTDILEVLRYAIPPLKAVSEAEGSGENESENAIKVFVSYINSLPKNIEPADPKNDPV